MGWLIDRWVDRYILISVFEKNRENHSDSNKENNDDEIYNNLCEEN